MDLVRGTLEIRPGTQSPDWYNVDLALQAACAKVLQLEARIDALENNYRAALEDIAQGGKGKALQRIAKDALDQFG